jgi:hypothetical protein
MMKVNMKMMKWGRMLEGAEGGTAFQPVRMEA